MTARKVDYVSIGKSLGKGFALAVIALWGGSQSISSVTNLTSSQEGISAKLDTLLVSQLALTSKVESLDDSNTELRLEVRTIAHTLDSIKLREQIESEYRKRYNEVQKHLKPDKEMAYVQDQD